MKLVTTNGAATLLFLLASCLPPMVQTAAAESDAAVWPVGVYILSPVQFPPDEAFVRGMRLGLFYGRNEDMSGVDLGPGVSHTTGNLLGLSLNLVNLVSGDVLGWQASIANVTKGGVLGVQTALLNQSHDVAGVQLAAVNYDDG